LTHFSNNILISLINGSLKKLHQYLIVWEWIKQKFCMKNLK